MTSKIIEKRAPAASGARASKWRRTASLGLCLGATLLAACQGTLGARDESEGPTGPLEPGDPGYFPEVGSIDENGNKVFAVPGFELEGDPLYSRAVLLTNDQWANAVRDILALPETPTQANSFLDPVEGFSLFPNNERVLEVTNLMRESYQLAAAEIALAVLADSEALARINAGTDADSFIRTFGRRTFRRPLTEEEVTGYQTLFDVGAELSGDESDFVKGANLVIEGMLQSPNFLYRTELSPDGAPLTSFELATKLSFWILGTSPCDALLDRAASGQLDAPEGISALVEELLADPQASGMIVDLYATLFKFARYTDVIKEDPQYDPAINAELDQVSRLFFQHIYEQNMGLNEILTSTQGFAGPLLAEYYGVAPAPATPTLIDLGPERPGYFSQVPYLMLMGDGSHSDAIHRGVFLNLQVMCAELPSPPGDIPEVPHAMGDMTDRERVEAHTGFGTCGEGCHGGYINPLGFAFENFDGLGRLRDTDQGMPVDTQAAYPMQDIGMAEFDGAPELMELLAGTHEAHACFAKSMMSYALSRDIVEADEALIDDLAEVSRSESGSIKAVLRTLIQSPTFLSRPGAN